MSEYGYGVAILNESKYGYATEGNVIRLSLLRAPTLPDANADQGAHEFSFAIYPHANAFDESDVVEVAEAFNNPLKGKRDRTTVIGIEHLLMNLYRSALGSTRTQASTCLAKVQGDRRPERSTRNHQTRRG